MQVGLARRESHARAARYTGWAQILVAELPATLAALTRGEIPEWRAMIVARETGWLAREHRAQVDAALAGRLGSLGDRGAEAAARQAAYRLDPAGAVARAGAAAADRRVTVRPAPDVMCRLSALLPAAQGVAAWAALARTAEQARAEGDPRGRGQLMADTLVQRLTGVPESSEASSPPVEINLVMTDQALFTLTPDPADSAGSGELRAPAGDTGRAEWDAGPDEPAQLDGYGAIPAELARRLLLAADDATVVWVRRLYRHPDTGELIGMDSTRRCFEGGLRRFLILRDRTCRTPWCDAPIRHTDHVVPVEAGGRTAADNGQGLCEACNYAKQAPGLRAAPSRAEDGGAGHEVTTTTPTGHTYSSRPPDPPGASPARLSGPRRNDKSRSLITQPPAPQQLLGGRISGRSAMGRRCANRERAAGVAPRCWCNDTVSSPWLGQRGIAP